MNIKIVNYVTTVSRLVQAFVDVTVDDWLRFNGLNFHRDGTLHPAQLTGWCGKKRLYRDAVQVLDADLSKLLAVDILAAINAYIALLPVERRLRPPMTPKPSREPKSPAVVSSVAVTPSKPKPNQSPARYQSPARAPGSSGPVSAGQVSTKLKPLPPPQRLLEGLTSKRDM
jgi:hypothetical protein